MTKLKISFELSLPSDVVTQTIAVLAMRRVGKTYTASVIAEEMIKAKLPFVALDPTGAWWGLRSSADGTRPGYPVIIIGGDHGDLPLEPGAGKVLADLVVDHPGYYVIDMSATASNAEQDRIAMEFAERLYRRKAKDPFPLHLFVDEADSFIPQRPGDNQKRMLGAFEALVRRGGIRGIGMTMITQRPAVINKNVLTQSDNLIVLRITSPQDQDAIDDWVKRNGSKEDRDTLMGSLASLQRGEAWFYSPATLELFKRVQIRQRETFNSSATPEVGSSRVQPREIAPVDLEALRDKIASTIEKAKQDDPRELRRRIRELEQLVTKGQGEKPAVKVETREVLVVKDAQIARLEKLAEGLRAQGERMIQEAREIRASMTRLNGSKPAPHYQAPASVKQPSVKHPATTNVKPPANTTGSEPISRPQQRILDTLATFESLGLNEAQKAHVAVFSDASPTSGSFANNLGRLRTIGLIDYPSGGTVCLTEAGRAAANTTETPVTLVGLHNRWCAQLRSGPQTRILQSLIRTYPDPIERSELARIVEASPTSGSFANNLGRLRSLGLIDYRPAGHVVATELLFPIGLA
jgi:hypothetical protein